ncbi:MAG: alpha/beta fold hydrolase [Candidatus Lokiarchaeota archaeon]|nr:alpha/beta fold hydrolase [Candidatus Lokiarchaeota archaeon]MBD3199144.1 alpha/beta fold hydrolase [Candidatus Lokiarchaeota archaeon]
MSEQNKEYRIIHKTIQQPIDHTDPNSKEFPQRIWILFPDDAKSDSPVFFHLGEEQKLDDDKVIILYDSYGKRNDIIYIQVEHRGYGHSITNESDQSKPSYVKIDQVLADYHKAVQKLKMEYNGPWIGAGYSYGGGLVINYAAEYPQDVNVILSSSGVIDWPFMMSEYDNQMKINFGEELYSLLSDHIHNLEPNEMFDENWIEREFIIACLHGIAQKEEFKRFQKALTKMTRGTTDELLAQLHKIDDNFADNQAMNYALSNAKKTLTKEEARSGKYSWRVWRYQQCYETGVFEVSENSDGLFTRSRDDFINEGIALFGEEPPMAKGQKWFPRKMVKNLKIPLIYVNGGMDPWSGLCLEPGYEIEKGCYFYYPNARHCPEKDKLKRGKEVINSILRVLD